MNGEKTEKIYETLDKIAIRIPNNKCIIFILKNLLSF